MSLGDIDLNGEADINVLYLTSGDVLAAEEDTDAAFRYGLFKLRILVGFSGSANFVLAGRAR